ncbi:MAG: VTT domain-containing protein [Candidatus Acidiferrales bacterium]|jgi:membrane protein YqaA with SNARE-associated domain
MKFSLGRLAIAPPTTAHVVRHWFLTLGGPGLILLGLLDSSVIPIPGSMDAMTIVLSAHQRTWWPYYAVMATVGSVVGAYLTYRLARHRGDKELNDRLSKRNVKKVVRAFERWGFGAIAVPALLPPPMPMVPFVIAAGALQYSPRKFLLAMSVGRVVRYSILGYLGAVYGRKIFAVVLAHGEVALYVTIGVAVAVTAVLLLRRFRRKREALAGGD